MRRRYDDDDDDDDDNERDAKNEILLLTPWYHAFTSFGTEKIICAGVIIIFSGSIPLSIILRMSNIQQILLRGKTHDTIDTPCQ